MADNPDWKIFLGNNTPHDGIETKLPEPPIWRKFDEKADERRGRNFRVRPEMIEMVNAALYLRRPLLITGKPGVGKSSLIYAVAHELKLGKVLR
jgi:MoxR-like ATPase